MDAHVGEALALYLDIEKPGRPPEGNTRDSLHDVMRAEERDSWIGLAAGFQVAEYGSVASKLALQFGSDLVTLGHDVIRNEAALISERKRTLDFGQIARFDNPGLVREHMEAAFESLQNAIDLATVASGEDDYVPARPRTISSMG